MEPKRHSHLEVNLKEHSIYKNIFNEFFEYTIIDNESDLENDFKPYIKVSKNNNCSYGIHTVLYTHDA